MNQHQTKTIEVVAAVIKYRDLFFCVQRNEKGSLAFKWEFPGGKIEQHESHQNALKRELNEELNLDVEVGEHVFTVNHQYPTFFIILHAYFVEVYTNDIKLNEHMDFKWLNINELLSLDWAEADIPIVKKVMELHSL
jgi:8-oxo-dGTP diphosphatase